MIRSLYDIIIVASRVKQWQYSSFKVELLEKYWKLMPASLKPLYQSEVWCTNEFNSHVNEISFSFEKTRFAKEVKDNSEMSCIWYNFLCSDCGSTMYNKAMVLFRCWRHFENHLKESMQNRDVLWRANARNVSFQISLRWPIHIINSVDKTKLSCNCVVFLGKALYSHIGSFHTGAFINGYQGI